MRYKLLLILIMVFWPLIIVAQNLEDNNISDSLQSKTYVELSRLFYKNKKDTSRSKAYANIYLKRAKKNKDTINMAYGFLLFSGMSKERIYLEYSDSIIDLTKHLNHKNFPAQGYLNKGIFFFYQRNFKEALNFHIKAYSHAKNNNPNLAFKINHNIAVLRERLGDHKEALKIFKNSFNYLVDSNLKTENNKDYLRAIFSLSNAYRRNHVLDSAEYYCDFGILESKELKNRYYYNFILTKGILQYNNKNLDSAISNILKAKGFHEETKNDNPNLAFAYFYYGKVLLETKDTLRGIANLKKVDSIFQVTKDIHPELKETYKILINHYKQNKDKNRQLEYIEKLIEVDSFLNSNYKYLIRKLNSDYDTPKLIAKKEKLISELSQEKQVSLLGNIVLIASVIIIGVLLVLNLRKKQVYKEKFDLLMREKVQPEPQKKDIDSVREINSLENIGIAKEVVDQILHDINLFIENEEYLNNNITLGDLAKKFGTNTKYLSKVINAYNQKNFINFINDLRIEYTIEKLKTDQKFRKYSIKAISESVGYGKAESFSNAFKRRTGLQPSYFIKEFDKKNRQE